MAELLDFAAEAFPNLSPLEIIVYVWGAFCSLTGFAARPMMIKGTKLSARGAWAVASLLYTGLVSLVSTPPSPVVAAVKKELEGEVVWENGMNTLVTSCLMAEVFVCNGTVGVIKANGVVLPKLAKADTRKIHDMLLAKARIKENERLAKIEEINQSKAAEQERVFLKALGA